MHLAGEHGWLLPDIRDFAGITGWGSLERLGVFGCFAGVAGARRKGSARQGVLRPVGGVNAEPRGRSPAPHAGNGSEDRGCCCLGR